MLFQHSRPIEARYFLICSVYLDWNDNQNNLLKLAIAKLFYQVNNQCNWAIFRWLCTFYLLCWLCRPEGRRGQQASFDRSARDFVDHWFLVRRCQPRLEYPHSASVPRRRFRLLGRSPTVVQLRPVRSHWSVGAHHVSEPERVVTNRPRLYLKMKRSWTMNFQYCSLMTDSCAFADYDCKHGYVSTKSGGLNSAACPHFTVLHTRMHTLAIRHSWAQLVVHPIPSGTSILRLMLSLGTWCTDRRSHVYAH